MFTKKKQVTWQMFFARAEALCSQLERDDTSEGKAMAKEASGLAALFKEWPVTHPSEDVRVAAIERLFELNRRVLDHQARRPPPSVGKPGSRRGP